MDVSMQMAAIVDALSHIEDEQEMASAVAYNTRCFISDTYNVSYENLGIKLTRTGLRRFRVRATLEEEPVEEEYTLD